MTKAKGATPLKAKRAATPLKAKRGATPPVKAKRGATASVKGKRPSKKVVDVETLRRKIPPFHKHYLSEGVMNTDPIIWNNYFKSIKESEGFDVKCYPGRCLHAWLVPLNVDKDDMEDPILCAEKALSEYNKREGKYYELKKIVSVNRHLCAGFMYYITFTAVDKKKWKNNSPQLFQAKARYMCGVHVEFCRLKR